MIIGGHTIGWNVTLLLWLYKQLWFLESSKANAIIIEVKSFIDAHRAKEARGQAAQYAKQLGLQKVTVAMFVPVEDESILAKLSVKEVILDVEVTVVAIGWV